MDLFCFESKLHIIKSRASLYTSTQILKRKEKPFVYILLTLILMITYLSFLSEPGECESIVWCPSCPRTMYIWFLPWHTQSNRTWTWAKSARNIRRYHCMCNLIVLCSTFSCALKKPDEDFWQTTGHLWPWNSEEVCIQHNLESVALCKQNGSVSHYDLKYHLRVLYNISSH